MSQFEELPVISTGRSVTVFRYHVVAWIAIPLAAILFQVYVPRFIEYLSYLELPLLVTVYFSLMRRQPVAGSIIGASIGLAQDSLSDHPLGMFGLVKTLVGFLAASMSMRFDVENPALRFLVSFGLFLFHQVCFWAVSRYLVGQSYEIQPPQVVLLAFLNAVVSVPLFLVFDRLKVDSR
jgi:rod shape-determining protein MreD